MSFLAAVAQRLSFKSLTISCRARRTSRHAALLLAGLFIAYFSIAAPAPAPAKATASGDSASIPQIVIIGKRMTPEQKRLSLEAEQRVEEASAESRVQAQVVRKR